MRTLFLLFIFLLLIPISESFAENLQITISNSGDAKISEEFSPKSTISNIVVDLISDNVSNVLAVDKQEIILDTSFQENSIKIASLGATYVNLSYDADIVSKNSGLWKISYYSGQNSFVTLPPLANLVSMNSIPLDIIDDTITMPPGEISMSYTLSEVSSKNFPVFFNGVEYSVKILTASTIENFIHSKNKISFDVNDDVPILLIIPNTIISEPMEVSLNSNLIEYQNFLKNNNEFWLRLEPQEGGHIQIIEKINTLQISQSDEKGGGCLIATAAYGTELAPQVQFLREIRDTTVMSTSSGTAFMSGFNQFYYSFSPSIADLERENPIFKEAVKITLTPLLVSLSILNYVDIDSDTEMLGYGISLIMLNVGMYFVAPTFAIRRLIIHPKSNLTNSN
jgi:hypothetical protein